MQQKLPILIVDKKGIIGTTLAEKLQEKFLVVLVTAKEIQEHENIIHIPYRKKIPLIPDNSYSHMFLVYNGENELLDMLPSFMKKEQQGKSKLFFITSFLHCSEALTRRLHNHVYNALTVMVYGELFDNRGLEQNIVNLFIHQARVQQRIEIPNTGLGKHHPVYLEDVLTAIIAAAFTDEKKNRVLLLFPRHSISEMSLARMLQKINPLIKLDFKKQRNRSVGFALPEGEYIFIQYDVEERLRMIDLNSRTAPMPVRASNMLAPAKKTGISRWLISLLLILGLTCIPLLFTLIFSLVGGGLLAVSAKQIEKAHIGFAHNLASASYGSFVAADAIGESMVLTGVFLPEPKRLLMQQVQNGKLLAETEINMLHAVETVQAIYQGKSADPRNDFLHALASVKNSLLVLQKMKAEGQLPKQVATKLASLDETITLFTNTSEVLPSLLGFEGKKKYLVLFQNNMELRPGGGFIGSYALVEMDKAKVLNFKVYDIYDADGKLKEHIEPPFAMRRYLGVQHWFMRDSNFNVDFPKNSEQVMQFLKKETGESVDGVLAMDTTFMKQIISVLGEVHVQDYKEKVTADNFYIVTQTHAEKDFFPGSTQKKDFLRSLSDEIFTALNTRKNISYQSLLEKIGESVRGKHLMIYVPNAGIQSVFTVNNMSSSLWDGRSGPDNTFLDFLGVVDANIGVNKSNYYVKRSLQQNASVDDKGDMLTTTTVLYENTSKKDSPFGGDYKNYVRFILPENSILQSVRVDGNALSTLDAVTDPAVYTQPGYIAPAGLEVEQTTQDNKSLIGFFLIVPVQSSRKVAITYTLPAVIDADRSAFNYHLRLFKQPGAADDPYSLIFTYPTSFMSLTAEKGFTDVGGKMTYSAILSEDRDISASFSKK